MSDGRRPPVAYEPPEGALAIGWATVELDRAERELAGLLAVGERFVDGAESAHLGARTRVVQATSGASRRPTIVILEPSTEGRLAAALARHGEGWLATWLDRAPRDQRWTAPRPGPLGSERLALDDPVGGPFRLWLADGTIEP